MNRLRYVTFTGVDERTDIPRLKELSRRYPFTEFGILFARNQDDNRYPDVPPLLKKLDGSGLRLSAHLCGDFAREAVRTGDFDAFRRACGFRSDLFARCQLNIAGKTFDNPARFLWRLPKMNEVIIQQSSAQALGEQPGTWEHFSRYNPACSILLDDSGGTGRRSPLRLLDTPKAGYAGGIGPDNVRQVLREITASTSVHDFWIDMEGRIRTNGWLDLDKVEAVCEQVSEMLSSR